jgi:hypothetical protein
MVPTPTLSFSEVLYSQVLRTVAFSARKTFAAEDRHSVDFRGMVDTSVEPYRFDYWSILTTLIIKGLYLSAFAESLSMCMIRAEGRITRLATIGLVGKIVKLRIRGRPA